MTQLLDGDTGRAVPERIADRYRIIEPIGHGGMGAVWLGVDEYLRRHVAIKQLLPRPELSAVDMEDARDRMYREARLAAQIRHPNVVTVLDLAEHDGQSWLILEYLPSRTLSNLIADRGRLEPEFAAQIGLEIAAALRAAHRVGVVHCDVKPANILISDANIAKLTDFGNAHCPGDPVTRADVVIGTPAYLPPERARGQTPTAAADVFSFGATLFAAVEGVSPFGPADDALPHLRAAAAGRTVPATHAGPLGPLLQRALDADPARRPTMTELQRELSEIVERTRRESESAPRTVESFWSRSTVSSALRSRRPARKVPAVAVVVAGVLTLAALAVPAWDVFDEGEQLTAAPGADTPPVAPAAPDSRSNWPPVAESPDAKPTSEPERVSADYAPRGIDHQVSDTPIEWSAAGQLVIDYYAGAQRADGWEMLGPGARRDFGNPERFREHWAQFSQVWAHNAYGVTVNDDGSVNVPVDVTYIAPNGKRQEDKVLQVTRYDGRLVISTAAR